MALSETAFAIIHAEIREAKRARRTDRMHAGNWQTKIEGLRGEITAANRAKRRGLTTYDQMPLR